jgi:signal transduction histidine kinase
MILAPRRIASRSWIFFVFVRSRSVIWALTAMAMAATAGVCAEPPTNESPPDPPLQSAIRPLRVLGAWDAEQAVIVRGRATWVSRDSPSNEFVAVQDDTAGIWIDVKRAKEWGTWQSEDGWQQVMPGMLVEVVGVRDREAETFAPQIIPVSIRPLAGAPEISFPQALTTTPDRLFSGADDSQRITIEGVVQEVRPFGSRQMLTLEAGGRQFQAIVPRGEAIDDASALIDATVAVTGVATSSYTTRGQFVAPTVAVARRADLEVVQPAPTDAFDAPEVPLGSLGRYLPDVDGRHRIRTRGTVSYAADGRLLYLQEKACGVRVEAMRFVEVRPGDTVEVAGFLNRERVLAGLAQAAGITGATVRVVGRADRPRATAIQPEQILEINRSARRAGRVAEPGDYDGCLIEVRARVGDVRDEPGRVIPLLAGGVMLTATVTDDVRPHLPPLEPGVELLLRGVVQFELEPAAAGSLPRVERMSLLVPSAEDIVIVSRPSWWTARRLLAALAVLAAVLTAALGWVALLRRQVAVQARRLAAEITERQRAEIEFEATLQERSRLAANLHDTVLQTVTGVGLQLRSCQRAHEQAATATPESVAAAQEMVAHAIDQLRGKVWTMRTTPPEGRTFPAALEALVSRLQSGQTPRITVHVAGVERPVPELASGNLLLLAEEAIHNALRHAGAGAIDVMAVFHDESVGVVVHDDGQGFAPGGASPAPQGHFGLQGMRERMERLGGSLTIESHPGDGTTVTATVPTHSSERHQSPRSASLASTAG